MPKDGVAGLALKKPAARRYWNEQRAILRTLSNSVC